MDFNKSLIQKLCMDSLLPRNHLEIGRSEWGVFVGEEEVMGLKGKLQ